MIRTLMATTAMATVIATGAFAQDATSNTTQKQEPVAAAPAAGAQGTMQADQQQAAMSGDYLQNLSQDQYLASNLSDQTLYMSDAEDAESAGEIQNLLLDDQGQVVAAIVQTDDALGDESRVIAIPFDQISWSLDEDNDVRAVLSASADDLKQAPAFTTPEQQAAMEQQTATGTAGTGMGTAGTGTDMAAAPAPATDASGANTSTDMAAAPASDDTAAEGTSTDMAAATGSSDTAAETGTETEMASNDEYPATVGSNQWLSKNVIGTDVHSGPSEDADSIGDINDLVVASSGKVDAAVLGVGGFLGIGEKDVAVPFGQFDFSRNEDNEVTAVLQASKEDLEAAPEFDSSRPDNGDMMASDDTGADQDLQNQDVAATAPADTETTDTNDQQMAAAPADNAAGTAQTDDQQMAAAPADNAAGSTDDQQMAAAPAGTATGNAADSTNAAGTEVAAVPATDDNAEMDTASTGGSMQPSLSPVTGSQLSADDLMGTTVYGPNDESIGSVGDIALTAEGGVDAIIVDVGGFLGIGAKPVALAMDNIQFMRDDSGSLYLYTQFTEDQLENAPEYNQDTYAESRDSMRVQSAGEQSTTTTK
ncbi:PRC-barrel domain-containing protein [Consotaella aegiceratis]|uniref:PRC-barrel domain-containing protein n=1 Tax=Consotaella aegiceratis TaxID=3097961 RepID=UPI002F409D6E